MTLITTFKEKRQAKQMKYERSVLKDLSINMLKETVQRYFGFFRLTTGLLLNKGIEEACYDIALESYLLGAHLSKFSSYGEPVEEVRLRCKREEDHLVETLYHFFLYLGEDEESAASESLYYQCVQYVQTWWREGYHKGERRHKLRLH